MERSGDADSRSEAQRLGGDFWFRCLGGRATAAEVSDDAGGLVGGDQVSAGPAATAKLKNQLVQQFKLSGDVRKLIAG